jgi:hypothetical protein
VLDPVTVTVGSVYGVANPEIPKDYANWEAVFGKTSELAAKGFTHRLTVSHGFVDPIEPSCDIYRICLRKWESA